MSTLDPPPANLSALKLPMVSVRRRKGALVRLAWPDPATYGGFRSSAKYRFDAPDGSFGVLYAAFELETAFAESVLRDTPAHAKSLQVTLDYRDVADRQVVPLDTDAAARPLRLIKLYDRGLAAARTDNQIATVDDYAVTRRWAKALYEHPQQPDGIVYLSRFLAPHRSVVLFDRCRGLFDIGTVTPLLAHPGLGKILDTFELAIDRP
jgi:hypothetical protein